ncbi:hypothetical protein [Photorhabdus khanii]|uniref:hypothetical protein n=1 Tax=Photorhabdus khanii TaxID=1004150 RepID=UPI001F026687|nr:hypothetical protein [Photorhabdus khanii]
MENIEARKNGVTLVCEDITEEDYILLNNLYKRNIGGLDYFIWKNIEEKNIISLVK